MQTAIARNKEQSQTESTLSKKPNNLVELKKEAGGNAGVPIFMQRQPVEEKEEESSVSVAESQVQTQLTVGAPDDEYERKADQVADTVMRMPDSHVAQPFEEEQEEVSGQSSVVQTKSNGEESLASNHQVDKAIRSPGGGSSLPEHIRARVGPVLGIDLRAVRVHDDSQGHAAARSINAKAFTHKNHIYLGKGQSPGNLRLMAHEATHVGQQTENTGASQRSQSPAMRKPMVQRFNESTETETTSTGSQNCDINEANPIIWFEHNSTNLRQDSEANSVLHLMRLVGRVQRYFANAGNYGFVFLYGYASEEGEPGHNLILSINRALYVRQLLIDAGIPAERIIAIGLGESRTLQELRWNRRVEVCLTPPVLPSQTPVPTPPSCRFPVSLGHARGCGSGADFGHYDFPSISLASEAKLAIWASARPLSRGPFRSWVTDTECEAEMDIVLTGLAGGAGHAAFSRFAAGTGGTATHGTHSTLGAKALISGSFLRTVAAVRKNIEAQLATQAASGTLDPCALSVTPPATHFGFSDGAALKAVIGGTQGEELLATGFIGNIPSRTYTINLLFVICDDFGVDESDLYFHGLYAFWVLQHERSASRYTPFINELSLPIRVSGTF